MRHYRFHSPDEIHAAKSSTRHARPCSRLESFAILAGLIILCAALALLHSLITGQP